jgi:aspartate dehydrogenase
VLRERVFGYLDCLSVAGSEACVAATRARCKHDFNIGAEVIMKRVALIGYGAMARTVIRILSELGDEAPQVVGILELPEYATEARSQIGDRIPVVERLEDLLALDPQLIAESAGQGAVRQHGEAVLKAGRDLLIISIGSLADQDLFDRLKTAARQGGSQVLLPAGALGGVDALAAGRLGGLSAVRQTMAKPPKAWRDTPAEDLVDLDNLKEATVFFTGSARDAATLYPKNANVAATVALSGLGFDTSQVSLIADPQATGPIHRIEAEGTFGTFAIEIRGVALPDNPKSSTLAALSIARGLANTSATVAI